MIRIGKPKRKFESSGASDNIVKESLRFEWLSSLITKIIGGILVVGGIALIFAWSQRRRYVFGNSQYKVLR